MGRPSVRYISRLCGGLLFDPVEVQDYQASLLWHQAYS